MISGVSVLKFVLNNELSKMLKKIRVILSTFLNESEKGKGIVMQYEFKFRFQIMYYGWCDLKESDLTSVNLYTFESNGKGTAQWILQIQM